MFLAKVVGTVWSTKKTPDLEGVRFLIVREPAEVFAKV
jgi:microcompartment protein CcmK/EutM